MEHTLLLIVSVALVIVSLALIRTNKKLNDAYDHVGKLLDELFDLDVQRSQND